MASQAWKRKDSQRMLHHLQDPRADNYWHYTAPVKGRNVCLLGPEVLHPVIAEVYQSMKQSQRVGTATQSSGTAQPAPQALASQDGMSGKQQAPSSSSPCPTLAAQCFSLDMRSSASPPCINPHPFMSARNSHEFWIATGDSWLLP